jgi:hypothetical protein
MEQSSRSHTCRPRNLSAVTQSTASSIESRESFIPIGCRSKGSELEDSEADIPSQKPTKYGACKDEYRDMEKAENVDIDTDREVSLAHNEAMSKDSAITTMAGEEIVAVREIAKSDIQCSFSEAHDVSSATTIPAEIKPSTATSSSTTFEEDGSVSFHSSKDSDVMSLRDFAATEPANYRVKRLSVTTPEHGPTLRISEDAEKILMGAHPEGEDRDRELGAMARTSASNLPKSTAIMEQFKAFNERMIKGPTPLSRSTTSRSVSNLDSDLNPSSTTKLSAGDARMAGMNDPLGGSGAIDTRPTHSMGDEDPFVVGRRHLALDGSVAEHSLPNAGLEWPLRCANAPHPDLNTVQERASDDEDSWTSPLATAVVQNNGNEVTPIIKVPNNIPAAEGTQSIQRALNGVSEGRNHSLTVAKDSNVTRSTSQVEGHNRSPFPARISSRTQFKEMIQGRSNEDRRVPSRQSCSPRIPNRFAPVRSTSQSKAISTPPASIFTSGTVRKLDHSTSTNGASSLQERCAADSAKAQLSATKGMLSNFRGLFHKRSLENSDAAYTMGYGSSVVRRTAVVGKNGSPFPFSSGHLSSKTLSSGPSRRHNRVTPTAGDVGADQDTVNLIAAFDTPEPGETQDAERLAVQVLDSAMIERNAEKKAKLVQVSCNPWRLPLPQTVLLTIYGTAWSTHGSCCDSIQRCRKGRGTS